MKIDLSSLWMKILNDIEYNLNSIETNSNSFWFQFKPTWIQLKPIRIHFGFNSNQIALNIFIINPVMKIKLWHVNLLFPIHVSGLVKGMKELGLDFRMECFHSCQVDNHTIGPYMFHL